MGRPLGKANFDIPLEVRFWKCVKFTENCWLWKKSLDGYGYGAFSFTASGGPRRMKAHRFSYEIIVGPIQTQMTLDHLCRNRSCVRPEHLEPVSRGENVLRGIGRTAVNARKVFCKRGHSLSGENLFLRKDRPRERDCRECRALRAENYYRKKNPQREKA